MQALKQIQFESRDPKRPSVSLVKTSRKPLPIELLKSLAVMMAEAQSFFPNQLLPEGTPAVFLRSWEEMADKYGLELFRTGLWKVLQGVEFFPAPVLIDRACGELHRKTWIQEQADARRNEFEEHARQRRERPTDFVHVREVWAEAISKQRGMESEKVEDAKD